MLIIVRVIRKNSSTFFRLVHWENDSHKSKQNRLFSRNSIIFLTCLDVGLLTRMKQKVGVRVFLKVWNKEKTGHCFYAWSWGSGSCLLFWIGTATSFVFQKVKLSLFIAQSDGVQHPRKDGFTTQSCASHVHWLQSQGIRNDGKFMEIYRDHQNLGQDCNFDPLTFPMLQDILAEMPWRQLRGMGRNVALEHNNCIKWWTEWYTWGLGKCRNLRLKAFDLFLA